MKSGDLVFVRGHLWSFVDDVIKLGEWLETKQAPWGLYTHVAIFMGGNGLAEAQGGRPHGAGYALLDEYAGNYDVGHIGWTDEQRRAIVAEAPKHFGKKYDWLMDAVIGVDMLTGLNIPYHERARRICSTFVREVILSATGVYLPVNEMCTPEDQAMSPVVTIEKGVA